MSTCIFTAAVKQAARDRAPVATAQERGRGWAAAGLTQLMGASEGVTAGNGGGCSSLAASTPKLGQRMAVQVPSSSPSKAGPRVGFRRPQPWDVPGASPVPTYSRSCQRAEPAGLTLGAGWMLPRKLTASEGHPAAPTHSYTPKKRRPCPKLRRTHLQSRDPAGAVPAQGPAGEN